jgi:hypothetical protein
MSNSESYTDTGITTAFYQGYEAGERNERERIIKLLKHNANHYGCAWDCPQPCVAPTFCELLTQIKGEQK